MSVVAEEQAQPRGKSPRTYLTSFVGRESDMDEVARLVRSAPVVTITGAGGSGKTRLAAEVATRLRSDYRDGVRWIDLSSTRSADQMELVFFEACGLAGDASVTFHEAMTHFVREHHALLVIDNCEHLIEACAALIKEIIAGESRIGVIATSREPLKIAGEQLFRIPSLSFSDETAGPLDLARVLELESTRLFRDRVRSVLPTFDIDSGNVRIVAEICARLNGIPLAIELVAARMFALNERQILSRLDDRFLSVSGGLRGEDPRHSTLQDTVGWSVDLLSDAERTLLSRLSVFPGSWTLMAAESICSDKIKSPMIAGEDVSDLLVRLVETSLVEKLDHEGEPRYELLWMVREYIRHEMLTTAVEEFTDRHTSWYATLAEQVAVGCSGGTRQKEWLEVARAEDRNFLDVMYRGIRTGDAETATRIYVSLAWCWFLLGRVDATNRMILERRLEGSGDLSPKLLARLCSAQALYLWDYKNHGEEFDHVATNALRSFELARSLRDDVEAGYALIVVGVGIPVYSDERRPMLLKRALEYFENADDSWGFRFASLVYADCYDPKRSLQKRRSDIRDALELAIDAQDRILEGVGLRALGFCEAWCGDYEGARNHLQRCIEISEEFGLQFLYLVSLNALMLVERLSGDYDAAIRLAKPLLSYGISGSRYGFMLGPLEQLAWTFLRQGRMDLAATITGAIQPKVPDGGYVGAEFGGEILPKVKTYVASGEYSRQYESGRSMSLIEAARYALAAIDQPTDADPPDRGTVAGQSAIVVGKRLGISKRETEVLIEIASGKTNQEVSRALFISEHTVAGHLRSLFKKIGCGNRTEAARFALEHGIVLPQEPS